MRKGLYAGLILIMALLLCACTGENAEVSTTAPPTYEVPSTEATVDAVMTPHTEDVPETTVPDADVPETTAPAHSAIYLPDYTPEQILEYFEEVVLHMEYTDGTGDASLVQKWNAPICYRIYGDPTDEDLAVLDACFAQLNTIPGFPQFYAAADDEAENLTLSFLDPEAFNTAFSEILQGEDAYGGVQFWYYTETNEIYTANIGYRTDIDQIARTSVLIEEIVNVLGLSDTVLREDSIVYQYSNENTALSDVDLVILSLLYDPAIQCGMDADSCRAIIRELYY